MLHVRHLPDFEGRLSSRHVELLIQYLTAPYLRIPLVMKLLSDESRVRALAVPELQVEDARAHQALGVGFWPGTSEGSRGGLSFSRDVWEKHHQTLSPPLHGNTHRSPL